MMELFCDECLFKGGKKELNESYLILKLSSIGRCRHGLMQPENLFINLYILIQLHRISIVFIRV